MKRATLPARRHAETFSLRFWNQDWSVTIGFYNDHDTPGEVFVHGPKSGTDLESTARDGAILLSLAMQYGVPPDTIRHALTRNADGSPSTIVGAICDRMSGAQV